MSTLSLPILGGSSGASDAPVSLIDQFLARQQDLSAVETFARRHETHALPDQAKYYRDLIPAGRPGAGQQYAFEVDLDACSGCKACVTACHTMNGLDQEETWRNVGLLVGGTSAQPLIQHVTAACHHCLEPACLEGCPVLAYEKDPVTGIVRHLDDQCIGCQYCILKCPYDVPRYNKTKGIVRKCDMCTGRLAAGEAPACVQGCPNGAIRIRVVDVERVIEESESRQFLPGAADPEYTLPTTIYKSAKPLPRNTLPADYYQVRPEHAHWSLIIMLVLTQLSVGAFTVGQIESQAGPLHAVFALALGLLALGASTLHLGRPMYAFRAVLGLRRSWLSREILVFGLFAGLASAYALVSCVSPGRWRGLGGAVAGVGLAGVFCSAMIYHDTRRPFWSLRRTGAKFLLSTLLLGVATTAQTTILSAPASPILRQMLVAIPVLTGVKLLLDVLTFRHLRSRKHTPMKRTALLLAGPLRQITLARLMLGSVGGVLLPLIAWGTAPLRPELPLLVTAGFLLTLGSEFLERYLFFTAVVPPRMPGGPHHE